MSTSGLFYTSVVLSVKGSTWQQGGSHLDIQITSKTVTDKLYFTEGNKLQWPLEGAVH